MSRICRISYQDSARSISVCPPAYQLQAYRYVSGHVEQTEVIRTELSHAIYRDGTIGQAKKDLEAAAHDLDKVLKESVGGAAYVSVDKGLVTRSSAVIPIISLYLSILFKVMKAKGTHEGCIAMPT